MRERRRAIPERWLPALLIFWLAIIAAPAGAHMEGTCLLRLADAAEAEQRCQATMSVAGQCKPAMATLENAIRECQGQLYTAPDIEHAAAHGRERVDGSVETSPYQQSIKRAAKAQVMLEPNKAHFQTFFGLDKQNYRQMTDDYFDEAACPNAFRGVHGRYRLVGVRTLKRLALDPDEPPDVASLNWLFFEAHAPDACIAAPIANEKSPWGERAIVNIPRELLLEMAANRKQNMVYLCVTLEDCQAQLEKLNFTYSQYVDHIGVYHRLQGCTIGSALSKGIRFTKAGKAPLHDTDAFCQQGELDTMELNERKFIEELEGGLFVHGRLP